MSWKITQEHLLNNLYHCEIKPFWSQNMTIGWFRGKGDAKIHYAWCRPEDARHTVVISSGRIESLLKYKELIYDLYMNKMAVFILDHRGQGLSSRLTDHPQHGFVNSFDDYVDDLILFTRSFVLHQRVGTVNLLCHSMGSAIGALTLLRAPGMFDKAVFASPMFGIRPALPKWIASALINAGLGLNRLRNRQSGYFFGQTDYIGFPYAINQLTHCKQRYEFFRKLYDEEQRIRLGGVTSEWLFAATNAMNEIEQRAHEIDTPVVIFSADGDTIIDNKRQRRVAAEFPNGKLFVIPHAYHELFNERDVYREPVVSSSLDFFYQDI